MQCTLSPSSISDYRRFLAIKALPAYRIRGRSAWFPDEYASVVDGGSVAPSQDANYEPSDWLFDYQRDIAQLAIRRRKFCLFVECGLGKTAIITEYALHVAQRLPRGKRFLIVSPLMVIPQTLAEVERFYGGQLTIHRIPSGSLQDWFDDDDALCRIGITNYEAIRPEIDTRGRLGALVLDESSMLKSHYGKWGTKLVEMGRGVEWKLCATGTPAPNDRIEYANHAVLMDAFPNVNAFLARFFVNRGQTDNRWEMKPHALEPFYRSISHWCIFVTNPATYGWKDNSDTLPPIHVHVDDVPLTDEQQQLAFGTTGELFANKIGGIGSRSVLSQIAKGSHRGEAVPTHKPGHIRWMIESWPEESTIVWCRYNAEQDLLAKTLSASKALAAGGVRSIDGKTPDDERQAIVDDFKAGRIRTLITKPKILGFGLNLQVATRQVFSACEDSYEEFHQAVKRSNRVGSTRPLHVHLPVTDIERLQMDNVLRKARLVQRDTEEQEAIFRSMALGLEE